MVSMLVLLLYSQAGNAYYAPAPTISIEKPVIAVTGIGRVSPSIETSEYTLVLYADVQHEDEAQAKALADQLRATIVGTLKQLGGKDDDVVLTSSTTSPPIQGDTYYRVAQDVQVNLHRVQDINKAKEKFLLIDGVQVGSVTPVIADAVDYSSGVSQARQDAIANARSEANELARFMNVRLGEPVYVSESVTYPSFDYDYANSDVIVSVTIYYEIFLKP